MDTNGYTDRPRGNILLRGLLIAWLALLILISAAGLALLIYNGRYTGRIYRGVTIQGVDVGGLSPTEAIEVVRRELSGTQLPYIALEAGEQSWLVSAETLGGRIDLERAVYRAWAVGRQGVFRYDMITRLRLLWFGYDVAPEFELEQGPALVYLRSIGRQASSPVRRARLGMAGLQVRADASEAGREIDIASTYAAIERHLREALGESSWGTVPRITRLWRHQSPPPGAHGVEPLVVPLAFREIAAPLTEIEGAEERAALVVSEPLILEFEFADITPDGSTATHSRRWVIDQALLSSWLILRPVQRESGPGFEVDVDADRIGEYVQRLAEEIARPPREARFDYDPASGQLTVLTPGQNGYMLDTNAARDQIAAACFSTERALTLPVRVIPPRVTPEELQAMLPLTLISEGVSDFTGSTAERLQNIRVATARFHGVVVPPRGNFSFLQHLGLVTAANGYSEAWIIFGNRTILGPGGGVCQVSTTAFRAAFWAGFPIIERWPHSYRVSWYEPPLGLDAAVFSPTADMRFENDTDAPVLILTEVDEANNKLYFRFYSRPTGRQVRMEGPVTANPVPAGDPIYEQDLSLAPGERVQAERAHDGIDVTIERIVERDGTIVRRDEVFSRYVPWPARYLVGPPRTTSGS
ncbi:MAG: VanW family protein [Anaerolineae bacterium]|jgi:vancomycin resistance protein YoaR